MATAHVAWALWLLNPDRTTSDHVDDYARSLPVERVRR
jgi:hypothetical protein